MHEMIEMEEEIEIRIVNVDYYITSPNPKFDKTYSEFRSSSIQNIPIIRIFGSTKGKKICLHVHDVFPYLYIPFDKNDDPHVLKYQIASNIDKALNILFGKASSNQEHVYKINLISGIPFYGYHPGEHLFFQIFFYNPALIRRIANLLQSDTILGRVYQPHEAHIPYILQFMIDNNLHGMSYIRLSKLTFRTCDNDYNNLLKESLCELEADCCANFILNKEEVQTGAVNPGIFAIWEDERQRRRDKSEESLIGSCLTLKNDQVEPSESHKHFRDALEEKLSSLSDSLDSSISNSVYPIETPESNEENDDVLNESLSVDATLNEEGKNLYNIFLELALMAKENENQEDCILSQLKMDDEDVEENSDLDMTLPLVVTPIKNHKDSSEDSDEDMFNSTLVPQVDGNCDSSSEEEEIICKLKFSNRYQPLSVSTIGSTKKAEYVLPCNAKKKIDFDNESILMSKSSICLNKSQTNEDYFNTVDKLSEAEMYDLSRNFQPKQSHSSKMSQDNVLHEKSILKQETLENFDYNVKKVNSTLIITPIKRFPTRLEILSTFLVHKIPKNRFETPFYGNANDIAESKEIGLSILKINSKTSATNDDFHSFSNGIKNYRKDLLPAGTKWNQINNKRIKLAYCKNINLIVEPLKKTPTVQEVKKWLLNQENKTVVTIPKKCEKIKIMVPKRLGVNCSDDESLDMSMEVIEASPVLHRKKIKLNDSGQISGKSLDFTGFLKETPENYQNVKTSLKNYQYLTIISLELHMNTRGDLKPDPKYDSIISIFFTIYQDAPNSCPINGIISMAEGIQSLTQVDYNISYSTDTEIDLFSKFIEIFRDNDPDIMVGYEIEMLSWGYLIERANCLEIDLLAKLSRIRDKNVKIYDEELDVKITGRIILDIWRIMRSEIILQSYTFENIVFNVLKKRIPCYSFKDLTVWWGTNDTKNYLNRHRVLVYYFTRVEANIQLLEQLDLIGRTSELARLFGIQFFEVLSRGSQFRVESMMLRLAKPLNYIPVSPSVQQRAKMKAPEFLPLILEPQSKYYTDPVIVLDFQSLYPSIIIAYNYCFSTCIGRVKNLGGNSTFEFGATEYRIKRALVEKLLRKNELNFSPCGVGFVKKTTRDGILPRMLREILETRLMVKNSIKSNQDNKTLKKVLHSRQLGLKLIANVTYGYTSANFSGRMPLVELGDSVVSKARETLQKAIKLVEENEKWAARVVYGDTDSLFVLVEGRGRDEAFQIGKEIADAVTEANPDPIKLKLEKVYQPCILQTKKRYVGYMYENEAQKEPAYDAKGIETVRRDGCPAVSKMLEKCIRLLFETNDISLIKNYVLRQFNKVFSGRVSLQDLTFAKEYRGAAGYKPGACVPALELARKWSAIDQRLEPRNGERVPYIISNGPPGLPLIKLVKSPFDFLSEPSLRPNALYYITKAIIPPINRCFSLIGVDVNNWFSKMPRRQYQYFSTSSSPGRNKFTISQYFATTNCAVCGDQSQGNLCDKCRKDNQRSAVILWGKIGKWERNHIQTKVICSSCMGNLNKTNCMSLDCPVLYRLHQTSRDFQQSSYLYQVLNSIQCDVI